MPGEILRIGFGEDIHRLEVGLPLIIGGVQIPSPVGALSYSDGDALIHAICDALLGAAALGDIGTYFPDTDPSNRGCPSSFFLSHVRRMLEELGGKICNIDAVVFLEKVRLAPHIQEIRKSLSRMLDISINAISVKASTYEGMGPVGEGLAILARVVALVSFPADKSFHH